MYMYVCSVCRSKSIRSFLQYEDNIQRNTRFITRKILKKERSEIMRHIMTENGNGK